MQSVLGDRLRLLNSRLAQGQLPSPPQLAAFLQETVAGLSPYVGTVPPPTRSLVQAGFASLGWDVVTNGAKPGSNPPRVDAVVACFNDLLTKLGSDLGSPVTHAEALKKVSELQKSLATAQRDLAFVREELEDDSISVKKYRQLEKEEARHSAAVTKLKRQLEDETLVLQRIEASLDPADLAAAQETQAKAAASSSSQPTADHSSSVIRPSQRHTVPAHGARKPRSAPVGEEASLQLTPPKEGEIEFIQASTLRKGMLVILNEKVGISNTLVLWSGYVMVVRSYWRLNSNLWWCRPQVCRVSELSTSKTGKHGHAKVKIAAKDVISGKNVLDMAQSQSNVTVPSKAWVDANRARLR